MHLYDLTALGDEDLAWKAIVFLTSHPLRPTDEAALDAYEDTRADALAAEVHHAERAWLVTDADHRPKALLALCRFSSLTSDGLMWAVAHPDLATPMEELLAVIGPALSEIAALRPALWAWKAPADTPSALPRLDNGKSKDLLLVGPDPAPLSPAWLAQLQADYDFTGAAAHL